MIRPYFYFIYLFFLGSTALAQSTIPSPATTRNFIKVWEATAPETNANTLITKNTRAVKHSVTYFDGLGRPEQSIVKNGSLSSTGTGDLVTPFVYDQYGREAIKYLPYVSASSDGLFKDGFLAEQQGFYTGSSSPVAQQGEAYFYRRTDFEPSPLNRPTKALPPGNSWVGAERGIETSYQVNTATDAVRIWTVTEVAGAFGTYSTTATYAAGELYKNITADEHGKQVVEFKDKEGKQVLKKVQFSSSDDGTGSGHGGWLCTYYIYDDLGQLRAVLQPAAVEAMNNAGNWAPDATLLDEWVFRYEYDARGRMILKKVPGAGPVQMVYDARDRLVMTQDANLRAAQKWLVTVYENNLNRPEYTYLIQDPYHYSNAAYHRNQADGSIAYPAVGSYANELLTQTHYDDYAGLPAGLYSTLYNSGYGIYLTASTASPDYAEPLTQSYTVKGMITWTSVKVLGTTSRFISTVNIYDAKGRIIQAQTLNASGGLDVVTNQYSFAGQLLISHQKHEKGGTNPQSYDIATKNNYDDLGRITGIAKNINNSGWKAISSLSYDALGQLREKKLSPAFNNGAGLETLQYDYNIRGWVLGINRDYLRDRYAAGYQEKYFGFELGYDKNISVAGAGGDFWFPQFNGNIAGTTWKSRGDQVRRKYDFEYDAAGRFGKAIFNQQANPAGSAGSGSWNATEADFSVHGFDADNNWQMKYDANGNILGMIQKGLKTGTPAAVVDALRYEYNTNSNKLKRVTDDYNDNSSRLGDFKYEAATKGATDYSYDANGNLTADNNKKISSISYNHLNLPGVITVPGKGTISYTYDAAGNKQGKETVDISASGKTITTTTTYLGGFVYESKSTRPADAASPDYTDALQFTAQEEGRVRQKADGSFVYDYFIKDQLGNVRMVLTEEQQTDRYPAATMETAATGEEEKYYANIPASRSALPAGYPANTPAGNAQAARVKAAAGSQKTGPAITLKVMSGDRFNVSVNSWYKNNGVTTPGNPVSPLTELLNALSGSIAGAGAKASPSEILNSGVLSPALMEFLNSQSPDATKPKAFINWILFDEQFKLVTSSSGFEQVGNELEYKTHVKLNMPVDANGYLYIYVSNETPDIDVFFDNLQVTHTRGAILEETHYYPFGLTMSGISSKAAGGLENRRKYNGIEFDEDLGIDSYEAFYRNLDPQIGRWWQIDPKTEGQETESPYSSMANNPILKSDPLGDVPETGSSDCGCCPDWVNTVVTTVVATAAVLVDNLVGTNATGAIAASGAVPSTQTDNWNSAVTSANKTSQAVGAFSILAGGVIASGSNTLTTVSLGATAEITVPTALVGAGIAVAGAVVTMNSTKNLSNGNGLIKKEADNKAYGSRQVEKGDRARSTDNANEKYEEITKAKDKAGKSKPSNQSGDWEGVKKRQQNSIKTTEKSKQRQNYYNNQGRN